MIAPPVEVENMDLPGYRLHQLKGDLRGTWAVTVSGNWRITFRFEDGNAHDVDYLDYHQEAADNAYEESPPPRPLGAT